MTGSTHYRSYTCDVIYNIRVTWGKKPPVVINLLRDAPDGFF